MEDKPQALDPALFRKLQSGPPLVRPPALHPGTHRLHPHLPNAGTASTSRAPPASLTPTGTHLHQFSVPNAMLHTAHAGSQPGPGVSARLPLSLNRAMLANAVLKPGSTTAGRAKEDRNGMAAGLSASPPGESTHPLEASDINHQLHHQPTKPRRRDIDEAGGSASSTAEDGNDVDDDVDAANVTVLSDAIRASARQISKRRISPAVNISRENVGDKVVLAGKGGGTLKYFGVPVFAPTNDQVWLGIDLERPVGEGDGLVEGIRYFKTNPKHAIFVPLSEGRVVLAPQNFPSSRLPPPLRNTWTTANDDNEASATTLATAAAQARKVKSSVINVQGAMTTADDQVKPPVPSSPQETSTRQIQPKRGRKKRRSSSRSSLEAIDESESDSVHVHEAAGFDWQTRDEGLSDQSAVGSLNGSDTNRPAGARVPASLLAADAGHDDASASFAPQVASGEERSASAILLDKAADNVLLSPSRPVSASRTPPEGVLTPLLTAAQRGQVGTIKFLLTDTTIDIDQRDHYGRTALMHAVHFGHQDCVSELLKQGADVNASEHPDIDTNCRDSDGRLPLHWAMDGKSKAVIHELLKHNPEHLNARDGQDMTPLMWACFLNRPAVVRMLLPLGADVDEKDIEGKTALHWAVYHPTTDCLEQLLSPARVFFRDGRGCCVCHAAAESDNVAALEMVHAMHADAIHVPDKKRRTPLHWAAACGAKHSLQRLIELGADVMARDTKGATAEMYVEAKLLTWRLNEEQQQRFKECADVLRKAMPIPRPATASSLGSVGGLSIGAGIAPGDVIEADEDGLSMTEVRRETALDIAARGTFMTKLAEGGRGVGRRKFIQLKDGVLRWGKSSKLEAGSTLVGKPLKLEPGPPVSVRERADFEADRSLQTLCFSVETDVKLLVLVAENNRDFAAFTSAIASANSVTEGSTSVSSPNNNRDSSAGASAGKTSRTDMASTENNESTAAVTVIRRAVTSAADTTIIGPSQSVPRVSVQEPDTPPMNAKLRSAPVAWTTNSAPGSRQSRRSSSSEA